MNCSHDVEKATKALTKLGAKVPGDGESNYIESMNTIVPGVDSLAKIAKEDSPYHDQIEGVIREKGSPAAQRLWHIAGMSDKELQTVMGTYTAQIESLQHSPTPLTPRQQQDAQQMQEWLAAANSVYSLRESHILNHQWSSNEHSRKSSRENFFFFIRDMQHTEDHVKDKIARGEKNRIEVVDKKKGHYKIHNIQPKDHTWGGQKHEGWTNDKYSAEIEGDTITIRQESGHKGPLEKTFKVGQLAEYDSYNLSYMGPIVKITPKQVVVAHHDINGKRSNMDLYSFIWRNIDFDADKKSKENSEAMYYL